MSDWMPSKREERLIMVGNWITQFELGYASTWGVPLNVVTKLKQCRDNAALRLSIVQDRETDTPVARQECKDAFDKLEVEMRSIKKHYFLVPPLTNANLVLLGFSVPDSTHSPMPDPKDLVEFEISTVPSDHRIIAHFHIAGSASHGKGHYHAAEIRFWVRELTAPAPLDADDEGWRSEADTHSPWEKSFPGADAGKRLYILMRWENSTTGTKGKGPWSAIANLIIP
jgi:hypothetical protein